MSIDDDANADSETSAAAKSPGTSRLIENVEVSLEAFVGGTRLTVAELTALRPGATLKLDAALNQAVGLQLNGKVVARGELVAVGDRFGVRLTEVTE